jgi:hypothetical protein
MARTFTTVIGLLLAVLAFSGTAQAAGGNYVFDGGTTRQQREVRAALDASSFDWSLVPARIVVHVAPGADTHATPGHVYVDSKLLSAGRFAWGIVQHEYAHQVDFFLLNPELRAKLGATLGGKEWFPGTTLLDHAAYGCERFASTLAWAYWPSPQNSLKPRSAKDESAAVAPARFRALMAGVLAGAK